MSKLNICIAGLGNVGSSLVETIEENKNYFFDKTDIELNIVGISARTKNKKRNFNISNYTCLLYTSPSPRDGTKSRMPSSA